jgi:hypothetical protein
MKAAQFKNRLVLILFLKLAYELFKNLFAFLKICFKIKMNGGLRSKGMREYFLLALLILTSLFPKPSLGGHQSILNPECTPCHSQNRIQQHGGFCATFAMVVPTRRFKVLFPMAGPETPFIALHVM